MREGADGQTTGAGLHKQTRAFILADLLLLEY